MSTDSRRRSATLQVLALGVSCAGIALGCGAPTSSPSDAKGRSSGAEPAQEGVIDRYPGGATRAEEIPLADEAGAYERIEYYRSGAKLSQSVFRASQPDGPYVEFHPDGSRKRAGAYAAGQRVGTWQEWHPGGALASEVTYAAGERDGSYRRLDAQGVTVLEGRYAGGRPTGAWTARHGDGSKAAEGRFVDGEPEGDFVFYHQGGGVSERRRYVNGALDGEASVFDASGRRVGGAAYEGGQLLESSGGWCGDPCHALVPPERLRERDCGCVEAEEEDY